MQNSEWEGTGDAIAGFVRTGAGKMPALRGFEVEVGV